MTHKKSMTIGALRAAALIALATASASAAQGVYGIGNFDNFGTQTLYFVEPGVDSTITIGNTGLREVAGLEYDVANDRLLALDILGDLYSVDRTTGASTLMLNTGALITEGSVAVGSATYTTMFDDLHRLDGGAWVSVGASGLTDTYDISGLEFDGTGNLFAVASNGDAADTLLRFDTLTGAALIVAEITGAASGGLGGLAFNHQTGAMYLTNGSMLYTLDLTSGAATAINSLAMGISGIAYVPSPSTAALAGVGMMLIAARRRSGGR
jgi:hypothetical protein